MDSGWHHPREPQPGRAKSPMHRSVSDARLTSTPPPPGPPPSPLPQTPLIQQDGTKIDEPEPTAPIAQDGERVVDGENITSFGAYNESAETGDRPGDVSLEATGMVLLVASLENVEGESRTGKMSVDATAAVEEKEPTDRKSCLQLDPAKHPSRSEKADSDIYVEGVGEEGPSVHIPQASPSDEEERAAAVSTNTESGMAMPVSSLVNVSSGSGGLEQPPPLPMNQAELLVAEEPATSDDAAVSTTAAELVGETVEFVLSKVAVLPDTTEHVEIVENADHEGESHLPRTSLAMSRDGDKNSSGTETAILAMQSESSGQVHDLPQGIDTKCTACVDTQSDSIDPDCTGATDADGSSRAPQEDALVGRDSSVYAENHVVHELEVSDGNDSVDPTNEANSIELPAEGKHLAESEHTVVGLVERSTEGGTTFSVQSSTRGSKSVGEAEICDLAHTEKNEHWILDDRHGTPRASSIIESLSTGLTIMEREELDTKAQALVEAVLRDLMSALQVLEIKSAVSCEIAVSDQEGSIELCKPKDGSSLKGEMDMSLTQADPQDIRTDGVGSSEIALTTAVVASKQRGDDAGVDTTADADTLAEGGEPLGINALGQEIPTNESLSLMSSDVGEVGMVGTSGVSERVTESTEAIPAPTSGLTTGTGLVMTLDEELTAAPVIEVSFAEYVTTMSVTSIAW